MINMKRIALLVMCGALLLSGCNSEQKQETTTTATTIVTQQSIAEEIEEVADIEVESDEQEMPPESTTVPEFEFRPDKEMPYAFIPEQCYADYNQSYYIPLEPMVADIPSDLIALISEEEFEAWRSKAEDNDKIPTDLNDMFGIYSFIHNTSVPKDKAEELLLQQMDFWNEMNINPNFTPEGISALINGDKEKVIELYKHKSAIYINGKLLSPQWLYEKPLSDWRKEGITLDMINDVYADIMTLPFSVEGATAFKSKVEYYSKNYYSECK